MRKPATLTVAAEEDVAGQAVWIAKDNPEAAACYIHAVAETISFLEDNPQTGTRYPTRAHALRGLRKRQVTGFHNYLIFYLERDDSLLVVRILHGARDLPAVLEE